MDGTLDLNGYAVAVGGLSGSGTVTASTGCCTLTVGANGQSSEFDGQIEDGFGTVALTKVGSGTLTLGGANSYIGGTTVSGGTLRVGNDDAIPSVVAASNGNLEVDGTLDLNGYSITVNGLTGSPSGLITTGVSGNCTLTVAANDQIERVRRPDPGRCGHRGPDESRLRHVDPHGRQYLQRRDHGFRRRTGDRRAGHEHLGRRRSRREGRRLLRPGVLRPGNAQRLADRLGRRHDEPGARKCHLGNPHLPQWTQ